MGVVAGGVLSGGVCKAEMMGTWIVRSVTSQAPNRRLMKSGDFPRIAVALAGNSAASPIAPCAFSARESRRRRPLEIHNKLVHTAQRGIKYSWKNKRH